MRGIIDRAFEIARSGDCQSVPLLGQKLIKEGFEDVCQHLNGVVLRKQLSALIKVSQLNAQLEPHLMQQDFEAVRSCPFKDAHFQIGG